jgi:nitrous oxide reductase
VKVSDSTNAALPQVDLVSDVCCKQLAVTEFLVANKDSVTSIHKNLCKVYTNAVVDRSPLCP